MSLRGKKVLITGGARGLGRSLADLLIKEGAEVLIFDREVTEGVQGDITSESDRQRLFEQWKSKWGELDILINNAGVVFGGEFLELPLATHEKTIDINIKGLMAMTHLFLPALKKKPNAMIVNMGSVTGLMGLAYGTSYASSKWAVLGFSESLRQEFRAERSQVHVLVVCPSYIDTGMFEGAGAPLLMPFLKAEVLAKKIVSAMKCRKHFVKEPWLVKFVEILRANLPLGLQDIILDALGVAKGMRLWRGRGPG